MKNTTKKIEKTENSKNEKFSNLEKMNLSNLEKLAKLEIHEISKSGLNSNGKKSFYNYDTDEMKALIAQKKKMSSVRQHLRKKLNDAIQPTIKAIREKNEIEIKKSILEFRKFAKLYYVNFESNNIYDFRSESSIENALKNDANTIEFKDAKNLLSFFECLKIYSK